MKSVLDASAVLALLHEEKGCDQVAPALPNSAISAANLCEVGSKLIDAGMPEAAVHRALSTLPLQVHPVDAQICALAIDLRERSRALGLSLGDRLCLATGLACGARILTADRAWQRLQLAVPIDIIR
ncbi:MAG: type II toxin-antitoxin system VapC family toxin [Polyangiales bacterium]